MFLFLYYFVFCLPIPFKEEGVGSFAFLCAVIYVMYVICHILYTLPLRIIYRLFLVMMEVPGHFYLLQNVFCKSPYYKAIFISRGRAGGVGRVTSYIWHSTDVRAE